MTFSLSEPFPGEQHEEEFPCPTLFFPPTFAGAWTEFHQLLVIYLIFPFSSPPLITQQLWKLFGSLQGAPAFISGNAGSPQVSEPCRIVTVLLGSIAPLIFHRLPPPMPNPWFGRKKNPLCASLELSKARLDGVWDSGSVPAKESLELKQLRVPSHPGILRNKCKNQSRKGILAVSIPLEQEHHFQPRNSMK